MTDREALFRAIVANPEEDVPRLAFADAIEEEGDADYAEFIRSQCELARLEEDGSDSQAVYEFLAEQDKKSLDAVDWTTVDAGVGRRVELARATAGWERKALTKYRALFHLAEPLLNWSGFHRGFPSKISIDASTPIDLIQREDIVNSIPGIALECTDLHRRAAEELAESGLLRSVRSLTLLGSYLGGSPAAALATLRQSSDVAGIRSLVVRSTAQEGGEFVVQALTQNRHWSGLRCLDLSGLRASPGVIRDLFRATHLRSLTRLRFAGWEWNAEAVREFAAAGFKSLVELRIRASELTDDDVQTLAASPSLGQLRTLDLRENRIGSRGASTVLASRQLAKLAYVSFEGNEVRDLDRVLLAAAPAGGLRVFHGHGCSLTASAMLALCCCPRLNELWYLDLDYNDLDRRALRRVLRGIGHRCPPILWMIHNRLDDSCVKLLADWVHAPRLQVLMLQGNPLSSEGYTTLLDSPLLQNLRGLGAFPFDESIKERIEKRFGPNADLQ